MTKRRQATTTEPHTEAVVWIDHEQAIIVEQAPGGSTTVERVDRGPAESEAGFEGRALDEVADQDRVVVSGPAFARTDFERAYVALTHRPDRLVDVEPTIPARRSRKAR